MSRLRVPALVMGKLFPFTTCASVFVFRSKDSVGWELIFSTPYLQNHVERMALNAKVTSSSLGDKMLAVSSGGFKLMEIWWEG